MAMETPIFYHGQKNQFNSEKSHSSSWNARFIPHVDLHEIPWIQWIPHVDDVFSHESLVGGFSPSEKY